MATCVSRRSTGTAGSLAAAANLADIDLSANKLTGALPALPAAAQTVDMSGNAFNGGILDSYGARCNPQTACVARSQV